MLFSFQAKNLLLVATLSLFTLTSSVQARQTRGTRCADLVPCHTFKTTIFLDKVDAHFEFCEQLMRDLTVSPDLARVLNCAQLSFSIAVGSTPESKTAALQAVLDRIVTATQRLRSDKEEIEYFQEYFFVNRFFGKTLKDSAQQILTFETLLLDLLANVRKIKAQFIKDSKEDAKISELVEKLEKRLKKLDKGLLDLDKAIATAVALRQASEGIMTIKNFRTVGGE